MSRAIQLIVGFLLGCLTTYVVQRHQAQAIGEDVARRDFDTAERRARLTFLLDATNWFSPPPPNAP
jgi:hypothetical protein